MRTIAEWLQRPMVLLWIGFIAFAEILSWETRHWPPCFVYVDEGQEGSQQSDQQECATFHVSLFKLAIWGSRLLENHTETITAIATVFIALFTLTLWRATNRMWESGERQLNLTGSVAERQARQTQASIELARAEFVSAHRPRIILRDVRLVGNDVLYMLTNVGATSATIVESWIMAEFIEQDGAITPLRSFGHDDLGRLTFAGGETKDLIYPLPGEISFAIRWPDTRRIGLEGRPAVFGERYFVGALVYADDIKIRRRSIFRRRWDDASHNFVRLEDERDHEYAD